MFGLIVRSRWPRAFARVLLLVSALLTTTVLAACGGDATAPAADIGGSYSLRTVAGKSLPATVMDTTITVQSGQSAHLVIRMTTGTLTLSSPNSYALNIIWTATVDGQLQDVTPLTDAGTYTRSGSAVTFTSASDQSVVTGTLANGTISVTQDLFGDGGSVSMSFQK